MGEESLDPRQETSYGSLNLLLQNIKDFVAPSAPRGDPDISQPKATPSDAGATTSPLASAESIKLEQKWRLFERRLDYGLKFFDHHAKQRMMMFYYFLVFVGFIFASFGALAKDGDFGVATLLAVLGAFLTSFFLPLERRNGRTCSHRRGFAFAA